MTLLWALTVAWLTVCRGESAADSDSLRGALDAINRRQRDLADPTLYYLEHFHPTRDIMYPRHGEGDGQPEDIGYGYQKTLAPKTAGIFEAMPLPDSELGSHDPGVESHSPDDKSLENVILDYIEENMGSPRGAEPHRYHYQTQNEAMKRSVFRERDVNELPSALQNLYSEGENSDQYFENGEHPQVMPSNFRERLSTKISRNNPVRNAHALVRNFGGLNRDSDSLPNSDDDPDEYLSMLNSVWEKYQEGNPENIDPEDITQSDVEEILEYINRKQEKKRQYDDSYENGYDFFNSPLAWAKRDRQRLTNNLKHPSDEFLHALKFLNSHHDTLESMREDDIPDDERDADVARLLLEQQASKLYKQHNKRFWRGNTYDEHHKTAKRFPVTKRSLSFYSNPAVLYHKGLNERFNQRRKKNVKSNSLDSATDPKVVKDLNNIFSPSEESGKEKVNSTGMHNQKADVSNDTKTVNASEVKNQLKDESHSHLDMVIHNHRKRSGQKEETNEDTQHKPLVMSKKSVDWSNYFGIDKRRKKSTIKPGNDDWLLDQYLKAYLISAKTVKDPSDSSNEVNEADINEKNSDDMDSKLRAMEDMIVDQALKYTGAHEGVTDPEEVHTVSYRVMSQLLAAFSLEKMREALREFKSSIAAQKASPISHATTNTPTELPDQKDKRVAIKKEKAEIPHDKKLEKKEEEENGIGPFHSSHTLTANLEEDACPIMDDITHRCKEIASLAGDTSETLLPLCNLHQVCYLCGSEMSTAPSGCDVTFLTEANTLCGDSPRCRYTVRRTMAAMHSLRGDPSSLGCDWQNHPCLARYVAMTLR